MKIAIAHNFYRIRGGEDAVVERESALLESAGHEVARFFRHSESQLGSAGLGAAVRVGLKLPYSPEMRAEFLSFLKQVQPDVLHVHNTFPLLTPAIFSAAREAGVATVTTLHNFRFICANGLFLRDGRPCEKCLEGSVAWGAWYGCYRDSVPATLPLTRLIHRYEKGAALNDLAQRVICLSPFSREKFLAAGIRPERLVIKPNFCEDPGAPPPWESRGSYALYVGRLSEEKGILPLLSAWKSIPFPLKVVGTGPQEAEARALAPPGVEFLGAMPGAAVQEKMRSAKLLVIPSLAYENFPLVLAEAWASGLPVAANKNGSLTTLVEEGKTGFFFSVGDTQAMEKSLLSIFSRESALKTVSEHGRQHYLSAFTPERCLESLEAIYAKARADITHARKAGSSVH